MIETARAVIMWTPVLIQAMKSVEEAIPGQGKGEQKLAAVRGILEVVASATNSATFAALWPMLEGVAKVLVTAFNATGIFSRGSR